MSYVCGPSVPMFIYIYYMLFVPYIRLGFKLLNVWLVSNQVFKPVCLSCLSFSVHCVRLGPCALSMHVEAIIQARVDSAKRNLQSRKLKFEINSPKVESEDCNC